MTRGSGHSAIGRPMTADDLDGPSCAICRSIVSGIHPDTPLEIYRGEWWCEACIEQEEEYQHDEEFSQ